MTKEKIIELFKEKFTHQLTDSQDELIEKLVDYLLNNNNEALFVIKGYAGTGKTTIVSVLVSILPSIKYKSVLLAPTGRAAKVLSSYSKKIAYTIHKKIYRIHTDKDGQVKISLFPNLHTNTIFLVDEASMISNSQNAESNLFTNHSVLDDLIDYVKSGENCKLIFIGDTAQLPPVNLSISPALDKNYLKNKYFCDVYSHEITDVVRQQTDSGILENATKIRKQIKANKITMPKFLLNGFNDFIRITGADLEDALNSEYSKNGIDETVVICRTNKRANIFNQQIRSRIHYRENEISVGDLIMVIKNNYFWLDEDSKAGFIANGDILEILKIKKIEEKYGFKFADITAKMVDYSEETNIEVKIMLDAIMVESPALPYSESKKLFDALWEDFNDIKSKKKRYEAIKTNPYFNALQVKFSYAITCHKAQGGQWNVVFVEQGYLTKDMINNEFLRWLYTAITRASKKLYLVNFNQSFFMED